MKDVEKCLQLTTQNTQFVFIRCVLIYRLGYYFVAQLTHLHMLTNSNHQYMYRELLLPTFISTMLVNRYNGIKGWGGFEVQRRTGNEL